MKILTSILTPKTIETIKTTQPILDYRWKFQGFESPNILLTGGDIILTIIIIIAIPTLLILLLALFKTGAINKLVTILDKRLRYQTVLRLLLLLTLRGSFAIFISYKDATTSSLAHVFAIIITFMFTLAMITFCYSLLKIYS